MGSLEEVNLLAITIADLPALSKLIECFVATQLMDHLNACRLLQRLQSAYRANQSVKTAVTNVLANIVRRWIVVTSQY